MTGIRMPNPRHRVPARWNGPAGRAFGPGILPLPAAPDLHEGTILARRPNQKWGIGATAAFTLRDGQVPLFTRIDDGSACCAGLHVALCGRPFEALEPLHQVINELLGGFNEGIALSVKLRHGHGCQFMGDACQHEILFPGMKPSSARPHEPQGDGRIGSFFRTLNGRLLSVRHFDAVVELAEAQEEFRRRNNEQRLIERLHFHLPRQAHQAPLAPGTAA